MNFQPIFWGGLIAGTLDMTAARVAAWLRTGTTPVQAFHFIASGLLGAGSFRGGANRRKRNDDEVHKRVDRDTRHSDSRNWELQFEPVPTVPSAQPSC